MKTYENKFDSLMHELLKQKQLFEAFVAENQELHRQLADLRAGRGCFLEIGGQQFALGEELVTVAEGSDTARMQSGPSPMQQTGSLTSTQPTAAHTILEKTEATSPQTPASLEAVHFAQTSSAATDAMPTISSRQTTSSQRKEEEQSAFRHELQGSFLLE